MSRAQRSPWKGTLDKPVEGDCPHADLKVWGALPPGVGHHLPNISWYPVRPSSISPAQHGVSQRLGPEHQPQFLNHRDGHCEGASCEAVQPGEGVLHLLSQVPPGPCLPPRSGFPSSCKGTVGAGCGSPLRNPLFGSLHLLIP